MDFSKLTEKINIAIKDMDIFVDSISFKKKGKRRLGVSGKARQENAAGKYGHLWGRGTNRHGPGGSGGRKPDSRVSLCGHLFGNP